MKLQTRRNLAVFSLIVLLGVAGRFLFLDLPNFTPLAAVAVFAGLYFSRRTVAIMAPFAVMVISNFWLDAYTTWGELFVVYGALVFPVFLSRRLRDRDGASLHPLGMGACAVLPSVVFFLSSNLAVWAFNGYYEHTLAGLMTCFARAIPFYKYSLCGDLIFVGTTLVAYELVALRAAQRRRAIVLSS